ncbi:hypothetical protein PAXRUDRAFT_832194 [Paxillus rubicundulus Ve08.2h10]|uniref:Uncharacterized protein n=1 Tax=Paxillus rubicundulus Ve08.2h10 TaxID=930991 RepID=A0A0D0DL35_9AGAM|nr:hypothetical protein PAXRUDRAFT_832194 [Paxillus rubicundulus Ve08.2h10]
MLRCPGHLQITDETWDALPDHAKAAIYAGLSTSQQEPASTINLALTGPPLHWPHNPSRDGPTSPYPYGNVTMGLGFTNTSRSTQSTNYTRGN